MRTRLANGRWRLERRNGRAQPRPHVRAAWFDGVKQGGAGGDSSSNTSSSSGSSSNSSSSSDSSSGEKGGFGSAFKGFNGFNGFKGFTGGFSGFKFGSKGSSSTSTSSGGSNAAGELQGLLSDVRRLGLSGIVFGAVCGMHGVVHGLMEGTMDRVLEGLSQIWFIFIILDIVLTAATWIAGGTAKLLMLSYARCPWCGHLFSYHSDFFQGVMVCPKCFKALRFENGSFLRDRPRFSRVDFSFDIFAEGEEEETASRQRRALPPVVDIDATVADKY